jgi:MFS family permease
MTRDLKILSASMLIFGIGEGMFLIFQPLYIQQLGADPIIIGVILGINGLVMALAQIPTGYLADRFGRRLLMWFSWIAGLIAVWMMALASSLNAFVLGLMLYGVTSSVMAPLNTYVQGARGDWSVGRAVSFVHALYNAGMIFGPFLGGIVAERFDLRSVYYAAGILIAISTLIVFFLRRQPVETLPVMDGDTHLFRNKRFMSMLGVSALAMFAVTLPQPLTANFLQNQREIHLGKIGQLGSLGALGSVLMMLIFGHLPAGLAMLIGQVGLMLFSGLIWGGNNLLWYGLGYIFLGGYRLCRAMTVTLAQPLVREGEMGLAFGVVESVTMLANMVAPILAGFLYDWRPVSIYPVSLVVLTLSFLLSLRFYHSHQHRKQTQQLLAEKEVCNDT